MIYEKNGIDKALLPFYSVFVFYRTGNCIGKAQRFGDLTHFLRCKRVESEVGVSYLGKLVDRNELRVYSASDLGFAEKF